MVLVILWAWFASYSFRKVEASIAREAIKVIAYDASLVFPTEELVLGRAYWSSARSPCVYTTNEWEIDGNSGVLTWDNWPRGDRASCNDFFVSTVRTADPRVSVPRGCVPAFVISDTGGPRLSYLVAAADGTRQDGLLSGELSGDRLRQITQLGRNGNFYYAPDFVAGNGMDFVDIDLMGAEQCNGFKIFRYQTSVDDVWQAQEDLREHGYVVGLK